MIDMYRDPNIEGESFEEQFQKSIQSAVDSFFKVPQSIVLEEAEKKAEQYVSQIMCLEDINPEKQIIKEQYIGAFIDKIRWMI